MAEVSTSHQSRIGSAPKWQVYALLFCLIAALVASWPSANVAPQKNPHPSKATSPADLAKNDDLRLYSLIATRVSNGENYYSATAAELRANNYPLRPFVTFRFPTLTQVSAHFGYPAMSAGLALLVLATLLCWWRRLHGAFADPGRRISAVMLLATGLVLAVFPNLIVLHELWAGILIALSLGLYRPEKYWLALFAAAAALAIRETALPFVLLMSAFALWYRRWQELAAWCALLLGFGAALYMHFLAVSAVTSPLDPASQGWATIGGWDASIRALRLTSALRAFPDAIGALVVPVAMLGWASWKSDTGLRVTLYLCGYAFMLMIIGRPQNFYWGLMAAPLLLMGMAFLPALIVDIRARLNPA